MSGGWYSQVLKSESISRLYIQIFPFDTFFRNHYDAENLLYNGNRNKEFYIYTATHSHVQQLSLQSIILRVTKEMSIKLLVCYSIPIMDKQENFQKCINSCIFILYFSFYFWVCLKTNV